MAAVFTTGSDGKALAHEHAIQLLEETLQRIKADEIDLYNPQFTMIDEEAVKGLLVARSSKKAYEAARKLNEKFGVKTRVVDVEDDQEVFVEGEHTMERSEVEDKADMNVQA